MCSRCAELELKVAELEAILECAIFADEKETRRLREHLGVSPDQARILVVLYKARGQALSMQELDQALPVRRPAVHCNRIDPEFRAPATVRQQCFLIRKKLGPVMANRYAAGVVLTEMGRDIVRQALAA